MAAGDRHGGGGGGEALLQDFLSFLADYVPTFPDELTDYYASSTGFQCPDVGVRRLMSVATQKFVAEVAHDAMQYCRMRQVPGAKQTSRDRRMVLTNDDLAVALKDYGVELKRPEYFANSLVAGIAPVAAPPSSSAAPVVATATPPKDD